MTYCPGERKKEEKKQKRKRRKKKEQKFSAAKTKKREKIKKDAMEDRTNRKDFMLYLEVSLEA